MKKYYFGTILITIFLIAVIAGYIVPGGYRPWTIFTLCMTLIIGLIDLISVSRGKPGVIKMFYNLWLNTRHNPKLIIIAIPAIIIIFFAVPTLMRTVILNHFTSKAYIFRENGEKIYYSECYVFGNADIENFHIEFNDNEIAVLNLTSVDIHYNCHVYNDSITGHDDYSYRIPPKTFETFDHDIDFILREPPETIEKNEETEFLYSLTIE